MASKKGWDDYCMVALTFAFTVMMLAIAIVVVVLAVSGAQ